MIKLLIVLRDWWTSSLSIWFLSWINSVSRSTCVPRNAVPSSEIWWNSFSPGRYLNKLNSTFNSWGKKDKCSHHLTSKFSRFPCLPQSSRGFWDGVDTILPLSARQGWEREWRVWRNTVRAAVCPSLFLDCKPSLRTSEIWNKEYLLYHILVGFIK